MSERKPINTRMAQPIRGRRPPPLPPTSASASVRPPAEPEIDERLDDAAAPPPAEAFSPVQPVLSADAVIEKAAEVPSDTGVTGELVDAEPVPARSARTQSASARPVQPERPPVPVAPEPATAAPGQKPSRAHQVESPPEPMTAQPLKQARAPEADAAPKRELAPAQVTVRAAATEPAPAPVPQPTAEPEQLERPEFDFPRTVRDTLRHVDQAWHAFRVVANRFPNERMDERLGEEGWTRKQMLAHVAAWHDLTADRLVKFITTGEPPALAMETDAFNASVARRAIGKTAGEILKDIEATFNRVRRQMARLSDAQLASHDWWAAFVIGGNTYGHYQEHWTDIWTPEPTPGGRR